jgi:hypothetical protein
LASDALFMYIAHFDSRGQHFFPSFSFFSFSRPDEAAPPGWRV